MPTTLAQWLDIETEAEKVFGAYLGTTLGLPTVTSDSNASVTTARIEVFATVEQMGPHQLTIASGTYAGRRLYDQFLVTIAIDLVYSPYWNATSAGSTHTAAALRGGLRRCLSDWRGLEGAFASDGLLSLAPDSLRQISGSRTINDAEKEEKISTHVSAMLFLVPTLIPT